MEKLGRADIVLYFVFKENLEIEEFFKVFWEKEVIWGMLTKY